VIRHKQEAGALVFTETHYGSGVEIEPHQHEDAYFCLIVKGSFDEAFEGRRRTCYPSLLAFHPAGERHSQHIGSAGVVSFNIELAKPADLPGLEEPRTFEQSIPDLLARRLYEEFREDDPLSSLALEGLALQLVAAASRTALPEPGFRKPAWVKRVREYLDSRFRDSFSLEDVAREVDLHPVYVAGAFHKLEGCTVGEYVRRRRIEFAKEEIRRGDRRLCEIAELAGFADQSHFTRVFRRAEGTTPREFQRSVG
jgi:AraC family transcriptional regulator